MPGSLRFPAAARRRMGLPHGCHAEAAASRAAPAGDDRGPPEEPSRRRGRPSSSRSTSSACSRTRLDVIDAMRDHLPGATAEEGPAETGSGEPRGTPRTAAGAGRCLAGRHPPHAELDHGRRATLSAVDGDGGQPDGRLGVGPSTGAGASARRVVVGGRPSGRAATGDGRPAPPRRDRGGVRRAATGPAAVLGSGRHRVCCLGAARTPGLRAG